MKKLPQLPSKWVGFLVGVAAPATYIALGTGGCKGSPVGPTYTPAPTPTAAASANPSH